MLIQIILDLVTFKDRKRHEVASSLNISNTSLKIIINLNITYINRKPWVFLLALAQNERTTPSTTSQNP